jgi:hypothetical protein
MIKIPLTITYFTAGEPLLYKRLDLTFLGWSDFPRGISFRYTRFMFGVSRAIG